MKLTELRELEKGTLLRLKGIDVIFKLHEVDTYDDKRPCCITVLEADGPCCITASVILLTTSSWM